MIRLQGQGSLLDVHTNGLVWILLRDCYVQTRVVFQMHPLKGAVEIGEGDQKC